MKPRLGALACAVLCVALIGPIEAVQATSSYSAIWTRAASGPWLIWPATAFAPTVGRLVVFGGTYRASSLSAVTYLFDPAADRWTTVPIAKRGTTTGPGARVHARMAWDPDIGRIVLFGGRDGRGVLQDTWSFDPVTNSWSALISSCRRVTCPPARWGHAMVWSSTLHRLVIFGGTTTGNPGGDLGDMWAFDGRAWSRIVTPTIPSARYLFGMAEDPTTGSIMLYGGVRWISRPGIAEAVGVSDTWMFDPAGLAWTQVPTTTIPDERAEVGMAWLPSVRTIVVSSGSDASGIQLPTTTTWAFDRAGQDWVAVTTAGGLPTPRHDAYLVTDTVRGSAILLGPPDLMVGPDQSDYAWILK